ncbi:MAG: glycosyltransferase family 4 protein [Candidatus Cloacimonetes bacterium]|nr:glycosyltransferase family 4 protein [Candidatus Cloacimonadota bacterium]
MGENSKKILILLGSSRFGGGEKNALDLVRFSQTQFDVTLGIPYDSILISELKQKHIPYILVEYPKYPWEIYQFYQQIKPYHLIHAHLNLACRSLTLLGPLARPWLATMHGFSSILPYLGANKIICVSQALQLSLPGILKKKSTVIYNGIEASPTLSPPNNRKKQAYVFATIHPNKGQEFLVQSLPYWEKKLPDLQISFVGTGQHRHEMALAAMMPKSSHITWIKKNQNLDQYWEMADFVIIPSYKESLSYVALEAQARGIPVLSAKTGGLVESTTEWGGILFEPGNPESLTQALIQMYSSCETLRKQLYKKPLLSSCPQFLIASMLEAIHQEWELMLR